MISHQNNMLIQSSVGHGLNMLSINVIFQGDVSRVKGSKNMSNQKDLGRDLSR